MRFSWDFHGIKNGRFSGNSHSEVENHENHHFIAGPLVMTKIANWKITILFIILNGYGKLPEGK